MAKFSSSTIEAVLNATDFVSLAEQYTKLERRGSTWWGCCPFHNEKTPSFQVNPEKKLFYCFGCHKGGNIFQFMMEVENLSFYQTIVELAKRSNIQLIYENDGLETHQSSEEEKLKEELYILYEKVANSFHHILLKTRQGKKALLYLKHRNISDSIIQNFNLGFAPIERNWLFKFLVKKGYKRELLSKSGLFSKNYPEIAFFSNRIIFPICDRHGRIIAFGGRTLSNDPKNPKYLNSSDNVHYKKKYNLFALNKALPEMRTAKSVIFCEGYMDVLAFQQAEITNAVAPLGTALTEEQINIVSRLVDKVYFCFDSDVAGIDATLRAIQICAKFDMDTFVIQIKNAKDPAELFEKEGTEGLTKTIKNAILGSDFFIQMAMTKYDVFTAEGKSKACQFLFPYLQTINSNIKREALINEFSSKLGVSPKAIYEDFINKTKRQRTSIATANPEKTSERLFYKNAETRAMLAVMANPDLFKTMRSSLTSDDFHDEDAKALFIFMEECYRDEVKSTDGLMSRLKDKRLNQAVVASIMSGEFSKNADIIVNDSIMRIKQHNLERHRQMLINKLNLISTQNDSKSEEEANEIVAYIADLTRQITEFKLN